MKAIPTLYKGIEFRSRLEADAASFFDSLGIRWLYEPQGFLLPSGHYLPDFYLTELLMWVEVKGQDRFGFHYSTTAREFVKLLDGRNKDKTSRGESFLILSDNAVVCWEPICCQTVGCLYLGEYVSLLKGCSACNISCSIFTQEGNYNCKVCGNRIDFDKAITVPFLKEWQAFRNKTHPKRMF